MITAFPFRLGIFLGLNPQREVQMATLPPRRAPRNVVPLTRPPLPQRKSKDPNKVYSGITDALVKIGKTEGIKGLWAGVIPSLWLVSNPSVQFVVYERVRGFMDKIAASQNRRINALEFFLMGAVAKAAATFVTYPLQIAQSKLRNDKKGEYSGTVDCLRKIFMKNGFKGLFQGITAKLYQTVLTAAFQFLTYEEVREPEFLFYFSIFFRVFGVTWRG